MRNGGDRDAARAAAAARHRVRCDPQRQVHHQVPELCRRLFERQDRSRRATWFSHGCQEGGGEKYDQSQKGANGKAPLGAAKAVYDYTDEAGKRLYQVLRYEPLNALKQFVQRTGPDQVKWSIKGVRRVLYRLPELIEAVAQNHIVFVVEGEKDVETLLTPRHSGDDKGRGRGERGGSSERQGLDRRVQRNPARRSTWC